MTRKALYALASLLLLLTLLRLPGQAIKGIDYAVCLLLIYHVSVHARRWRASIVKLLLGVALVVSLNPVFPLPLMPVGMLLVRLVGVVLLFWWAYKERLPEAD